MRNKMTDVLEKSIYILLAAMIALKQITAIMVLKIQKNEN